MSNQMHGPACKGNPGIAHQIADSSMRIVKMLAIEELMDGELATNCTSRWDIPGCVSGIVVRLIQFKVGVQATY